MMTHTDEVHRHGFLYRVFFGMSFGPHRCLADVHGTCLMGSTGPLAIEQNSYIVINLSFYPLSGFSFVFGESCIIAKLKF